MIAKLCFLENVYFPHLLRPDEILCMGMIGWMDIVQLSTRPRRHVVGILCVNKMWIIMPGHMSQVYFSLRISTHNDQGHI